MSEPHPMAQSLAVGDVVAFRAGRRIELGYIDSICGIEARVMVTAGVVRMLPLIQLHYLGHFALPSMAIYVTVSAD